MNEASPVAQPTYCATHRSVETVLRCGKCGRPICPRCLVYTPVGARCHDCARIRRLPTYSVSPRSYALATAAAGGAALVVGAGWGALATFFGGFLLLLVAAAAGYLIGESISAAVNRKRGRGLQVIAGAAAFLSYLISQGTLVIVGTALGRLPPLPLDVLGAILLSAALGALTNLFTLLAVGVAIFMAVSRFR